MLFSRVNEEGVITSLDLSLPDPDGNTSGANWTRILDRVLPHVDIFLPSIEEIVFMLRKSDYEKWNGSILPNISNLYLQELALEIVEAGVAITGFKLGDLGMYLQTSRNLKHFRNLETSVDKLKWSGISMWHPAFEVEVQGTTGAGDSSYGGFLTEVLFGSDPFESLRMACAVGACNVEHADSVKGILSRNETLHRIEQGWSVSSKNLPG